jgi:hypothetical protein
LINSFPINELNEPFTTRRHPRWTSQLLINSFSIFRCFTPPLKITRRPPVMHATSHQPAEIFSALTTWRNFDKIHVSNTCFISSLKLQPKLVKNLTATQYHLEENVEHMFGQYLNSFSFKFKSIYCSSIDQVSKNISTNSSFFHSSISKEWK